MQHFLARIHRKFPCGRGLVSQGLAVALAFAVCPFAVADPPPRLELVSEGALVGGIGWPTAPATTNAVVVSGKSAHLWSGRASASGPLRIRARLELAAKAATGAGIRLGESFIGFDGAGGRCYSDGPLFLGAIDSVEGSESWVREGVPFELNVIRDGASIEVWIDGERMYRSQIDGAPVGRIGLAAGTGELRVHSWWIEGDLRDWTPPRSLWTVVDERFDEFKDPVLVAGAGGALHAFVTGVTTIDGGRDSTEVFERVRDAAGAWSEPRSVAGRGLSQVVAWGGAPSPSLIAIRRDDAGTPSAVVLARGADGWTESPLAVDGVEPAKAGLVLAARLRSQAGTTLDGRRAILLAPSNDPAATKVDLLLAPAAGNAGTAWTRGSLDGFERLAFLSAPDAGTALGLRADALKTARRVGGAWADDIAWTLPWAPSLLLAIASHCDRAELYSGAPRRERGIRRAALDAGADSWRDASIDLWPAAVGAISAVSLPDGRTALLFEGGENARREHVLFGIAAPATPAAP
ncbi:MAG: hypothetical protein ACKO0W_07650 [Planctomycetota bacterium]